jgi:hypothetical protein
VGQPRPRRGDPSRDHHRPFFVDDPDLAFLRVQIDGTIFQGWLLLAPLSALSLVQQNAST